MVVLDFCDDYCCSDVDENDDEYGIMLMKIMMNTILWLKLVTIDGIMLMKMMMNAIALVKIGDY